MFDFRRMMSGSGTRWRHPATSDTLSLYIWRTIGNYWDRKLAYVGLSIARAVSAHWVSLVGARGWSFAEREEMDTGRGGRRAWASVTEGELSVLLGLVEHGGLSLPGDLV